MSGPAQLQGPSGAGGLALPGSALLLGSGPLVARLAETLETLRWVTTRTRDVTLALATLDGTLPRTILVQPADLAEAAALLGEIGRIERAHGIPLLVVFDEAPADPDALLPGADAYLVDPTADDLIEAMGQHVVANWSRAIADEHALDLVESLGDAVLVVDRAHRIVYHNPNGLALVQRTTRISSPILGTPVERALPSFGEGVLRLALAAGLQHGEGSRTEARMDPLWVSVDIFANPHGVTVVARDVTERHELEAALFDTRMRLARSERVALLSELVSGVAHEVRTPLVALGNSLETLKIETRRHAISPSLATAERIEESIALALAGWERAARSMKQLQRITRLDPTVRARVDLSAAVQDAITLFAAIEPGAARVRVDLEPDLLVHADARKLQQVVLNLLQNAVDATADTRALVHIGTRRLADGAAGLVVEDGGPGMAQHVVERMYDPLFTTKPGATGLGLGVVQRFVREHGGTIACVTAPGRGTTFTIGLPLVQEVPIQ